MSIMQYFNLDSAPLPPAPVVSLLGNEPGMALDFINNQGFIWDDNNPSNNWLGPLVEKVQYSLPSQKTIFDSHGIMRRISGFACDYDPVTGERLGQYIESAATNHALRSGTLTTGYSDTDGSALRVDNLVEAPISGEYMSYVREGTLENVSPRRTFALSNSTAQAGTEIWASIYAKAGARRRVMLGMYSFANWSDRTNVVVDLVTGEMFAPTGVNPKAKTEYIGNGVYRISIRGVSIGSGAVTFGVGPRPDNYTTSVGYTGDGESGVYVWGLQVEVGGMATSYIPTTTAAVTRAADNIFTDLARIPFSIGGGTMIAEFSTNRPKEAYLISDNRVGIWGLRWSQGEQVAIEAHYTDTLRHVRQRDVNDNNGLSIGAQPARATFEKMAIGFNGSSSRISANGGSIKTLQSVVDIGALSTLRIGDVSLGTGGVRQLKGHIKSLVYIPRLLTDAELIHRSAM